MFCLFRNTHLTQGFAKFAWIMSWLSALYWSYFAFIQKDFWGKISMGQAMFVDLILGLPLVIAIAVVLYAATFWTLKLFAIFVLPQYTFYIDPFAQEDDASKTESVEAELGKEYWNQQSDKSK